MRCHPLRRDTAGSRRRRSAVSWLLAGTGLMTLATACGGPSVPKTVIIAATATANEPAPVLSADISQMLRDAGASSTKATAYVVDPASGQPTVISLTPHRPDGQVQHTQPQRDQLINAAVSQVQEVLGREGARGPFDLLNTIATATRAAPPPATLVLLSSGLSTAGGLDMRQAGWDLSPASVAAQLKARGLVPSLAGYDIVFSGLADTSGAQPALALPQRTTLSAYWLAICHAGGAASCRTDETTRPGPPSRSTTPVPVVRVLKVQSVRGPNGATTTTLPDPLLFQFDSAMLLPSADSILQPLATQARGQHLQVSITGYASPDGGSKLYNTNLSRHRAIAVSDRLQALGLPAAQIIKVTGAGTAGQSLDTCLVQGQLDEAICAQLRHVVVTLSPAAAHL
jgi:outer membrane protein OmpA-like peptidoglycan-associated protein